PCEQEALIEEEAEMEGALATSLIRKVNKIRKIANNLLLSGVFPEGSRAMTDVHHIWDMA
ncbi:hypothetical protein A2U01_0103220, partial [Trifolium medium]|nr:hypothetical protein [Trifolium medium]